eukprot:1153297-Pelagomonas_calceolata.AAC.4
MEEPRGASSEHLEYTTSPLLGLLLQLSYLNRQAQLEHGTAGQAQLGRHAGTATAGTAGLFAKLPLWAGTANAATFFLSLAGLKCSSPPLKHYTTLGLANMRTAGPGHRRVSSAVQVFCSIQSMPTALGGAFCKAHGHSRKRQTWRHKWRTRKNLIQVDLTDDLSGNHEAEQHQEVESRPA